MVTIHIVLNKAVPNHTFDPNALQLWSGTKSWNQTDEV